MAKPWSVSQATTAISARRPTRALGGCCDGPSADGSDAVFVAAVFRGAVAGRGIERRLVVLGAVLDAVGTGELTGTLADVGDQLQAAVAGRALAITSVGIFTVAAAGAVDRLAGLALKNLWLDRDRDLVRATRDFAGAGAIRDLFRGLPVGTADATPEIGH